MGGYKTGSAADVEDLLVGPQTAPVNEHVVENLRADAGSGEGKPQRRGGTRGSRLPVTWSRTSRPATVQRRPRRAGGRSRDTTRAFAAAPTTSEDQRHLVVRIRRRSEEPRLDGVASELIAGSMAVRCRNMWSKSRASPASNIGRTTPVSRPTSSTTAGDTDQSKLAPSVPVSTICSRRSGTTSMPGCHVAAVRQREPDVEAADALAQEGAVLVPVGPAGLGRDPAQDALVHRKRRSLAEVIGDQAADADTFEGVEERRTCRRGESAAQIAPPSRFHLRPPPSR